MSIRGALLVTTVAFAIAGCASIRDRLGPRASFDLDCPSEQLSFRQDAETTYIVQGCGAEAAYYRSCEATPASSGGYYGGTGPTTGNSTACTWRAGYIHRPASAGGELMPAPFTVPPPQ